MTIAACRVELIINDAVTFSPFSRRGASLHRPLAARARRLLRYFRANLSKYATQRVSPRARRDTNVG
jgi:hypothetical protein